MEEIVETPSATNTRSYVWGLDLSGRPQGAGGIGGLLAAELDASSGALVYCYDANGNVGQVVDASDHTITAHYEYDPYGAALAVSGELAEENPYRFSTKYLDEEVGLYYYGYRFHSPHLGRWISRDPIRERGGLNLYVFLQNDGINQSDFLGQLAVRAILPADTIKEVHAPEADIPVSVTMDDGDHEVGRVEVKTTADIDSSAIPAGLSDLADSRASGIYVLGVDPDVFTDSYIGVLMYLNFVVTDEERLKDYCGCPEDPLRTPTSTPTTLPIAGWIQTKNGALDLGPSPIGPWYGGWPHETLFDFPGIRYLPTARDRKYVSTLHCTTPRDAGGDWNDPGNFPLLLTYKWRFIMNLAEITDPDSGVVVPRWFAEWRKGH
jgi:RHS repeat-associated protein